MLRFFKLLSDFIKHFFSDSWNLFEKNLSLNIQDFIDISYRMDQVLLHQNVHNRITNSLNIHRFLATEMNQFLLYLSRAFRIGAVVMHLNIYNRRITGRTK
jgi:hypothetical protein